MPLIQVIDAGLQTTVQDMGRPGCAHMGVSASGAADALSLRLGNMLVGNPENTAALEMTLNGGAFVFDSNTLVALTGSDFGSTLDGERIPNWVPFEVRKGQTLRVGATRSGARCYMCVHGGIDVALVLGSASTHLATALGGFEGRALRAGDELPIAAPVMGEVCITQVHPQKVERWISPHVIRATPGPQAHWFSHESAERLFHDELTVRDDSDRMGVRIACRRVECVRHDELLTEGVSSGAIQVPPDGQPILLLVDHGTTGGYPKIANVITADLPRAGQLKPRDRFRLELVSFEEARKTLSEQEEWIHSLD